MVAAIRTRHHYRRMTQVQPLRVRDGPSAHRLVVHQTLGLNPEELVLLAASPIETAARDMLNFVNPGFTDDSAVVAAVAEQCHELETLGR